MQPTYDPEYRKPEKCGSVTIFTGRTVDGGYNMTVFAGNSSYKLDQLCITTLDRDEFQARYDLVRDLAHQELTPHRIIERINEINRQLNEVFDDAARNVLGEADTDTTTPKQRSQTLRNTSLSDIVPQNPALAALAAHGKRPQVPPTKTRRIKMSKPMKRIIVEAACNGGTILRGRNARIDQLQVLARMGLMTLNSQEGTYKVKSGTLTALGWREAKKLALAAKPSTPPAPTAGQCWGCAGGRHCASGKCDCCWWLKKPETPKPSKAVDRRAEIEHQLAVAVADPRTRDAEPRIAALQAELEATRSPEEVAEMDALAADIAEFLASRRPAPRQPKPRFDWRRELLGDDTSADTLPGVS